MDLAKAPLARRMRPQSLDEFVGQEHLVGKGRVLRRAIEADQIGSMIFYGPPGTGKTALAEIIARMSKAAFLQLNAVTAGISDLRKVFQQAEERLKTKGQRTIVFIDEIHRFSRVQQDALLPAIENGIIVLIGATTENPFFQITPPLISRSRLFRFEPLSDAQVETIVRRALADKEKGLGKVSIVLDSDALAHLVKSADGDARAALNGLELAATSAMPDSDGVYHVTLEMVAEAMQCRVLLYDKDSDQHYDTISAFIKSLRGSDPDAAVYWLARMLHAGEDPRFIARRMIIQAAEDVGLADPMALVLAVAAAQAVELVGLPEARIPMAEAAIYIACAPKSNSAYLAIGEAMKAVEETRISGVPLHLRDASYRGAKKLGHGTGYKYPHDYPGHYVAQQYLPAEIQSACYYNPSNEGRERQLRARLETLRANRPNSSKRP